MRSPEAARMPTAPEESPVDSSDAARRGTEAALERHLDDMLGRLQNTVAQPETDARREAIGEIAGEYALGLLEGMIAGDGQFEAQLIRQGARGTNGNWDLESPLFTFLSEQMSTSLPTRLAGLERGMYKDPSGKRTEKQMLHDGVRRQVKNLVATYRPSIDPRVDRHAA